MGDVDMEKVKAHFFDLANPFRDPNYYRLIIPSKEIEAAVREENKFIWLRFDYAKHFSAKLCQQR